MRTLDNASQRRTDGLRIEVSYRDVPTSKWFAILKDKSDVAIIDEIVKPGNKKEQKPAAEGSQDSCVKRQAVVNHGPEISTIGEDNNDDDDDDDEQIELLRDKGGFEEKLIASLPWSLSLIYIPFFVSCY